eukprot:1985815-Prymnesium_polylepis.1
MQLARAEEQGACPRQMERLLLWSIINGQGKPGGGSISEPRAVRHGACFTVQRTGRAVHGILCEHRMLGLSVFSCGVQAGDARATCGADKATQGARAWRHGENYTVQRIEGSGSYRCEQPLHQNLNVSCCGGSSCGAARMPPLGVVETTGRGGEWWHAAWNDAAVARIDNSGGRRCESRMAGAEQQQMLPVTCCGGGCCGAARMLLLLLSLLLLLYHYSYPTTTTNVSTVHCSLFTVHCSDFERRGSVSRPKSAQTRNSQEVGSRPRGWTDSM